MFSLVAQLLLSSRFAMVGSIHASAFPSVVPGMQTTAIPELALCSERLSTGNREPDVPLIVSRQH